MCLSFTASLAFGLFIVFCDYYAVAPNGSNALLTLRLFVGFPMLGCVAAIPISVVYGISRRYRRQALLVVVCCSMFMCSVVVSVLIGRVVRRGAFAALAERSETLVEAVGAYSDERSGPPDSLEDLLPRFLSDVPQTGMAAYPEYNYFVQREEMFDGNPWVLMVHTSTGPLNFDKFMYYPLQNYPPCRCGNRVERIRDWAYMHD